MKARRFNSGQARATGNDKVDTPVAQRLYKLRRRIAVGHEAVDFFDREQSLQLVDADLAGVGDNDGMFAPHE